MRGTVIWRTENELHYVNGRNLEKYARGVKGMIHLENSTEAWEKMRSLIQANPEYKVFASKYEGDETNPIGLIEVIAMTEDGSIPEGFEGPFERFETALIAQKLKRSDLLIQTTDPEEFG